MDIKTCEEYVLARLNEVENENVLLKVQLQGTEDKANGWKELYTRLKELVDEVAKNFSIKKTTGGQTYVSYDSVWSDYDKEKYELFVKLFNLDNDGQLTIDDMEAQNNG